MTYSKKKFENESLRDSFVALRKLAAELGVGEQRSGLSCPFCSGGRTREHSFSLNRESEVEARYICHRASCSHSGRIACWGFRLTGMGSDSPTNARRQTTRMYSGQLRELGALWISYLHKSFGFAEKELAAWEWMEDAQTGDIIIPLRDGRNVRHGVVSRQRPLGFDNSRPKTQPYYESPAHRMGWFVNAARPVKDTEIVLVEDLFSAAKVSRQFNSIALLGTHLSFDRLAQIIEQRPSRVVIALDKDATEKAFEYQKQLGLYCDLRVAVLERDFKWCEDEEIKRRVNDAIS